MKTVRTVLKVFGLALLLLALVQPTLAQEAPVDAIAQYERDESAPDFKSSDDVYWDSRFTIRGLDGQANAIAASGSNVYVAGHFMTAENVVVNRVALWNGSNWSALGQGLGCGVSYCSPYGKAIAVSGSKVYVGGMFTTAGSVSASSIAVWNGSAWAALGSGVDGIVNAIAVSGNDVYVGGFFTTAGGVSAHNIAKWNSLTNTWAALGAGIYGDGVNAIAISGSNVYVGGKFNMAGGVEVANIARWNGSTWSALGEGIWHSTWNMGAVNALAASGSDLYVGGLFNMAGGLYVHNLARWDGSSWWDVGGGLCYYSDCYYDQIYSSNSSVNALVLSGSDLYVGGNFYYAGGHYYAQNFVRWDGSTWVVVGGTNSSVYALAATGGNVYVGGYFTQAAGTPANFVAKWNSSSWSSLGNGANNSPNGNINAIATSGNDVYVGGHFSLAGGVPANNIAKWNSVTNTWSALGDGAYDTVHAIAVTGNTVYIGGCLTQAGSASVNHIARWDGGSWSALGSGMNNCVYAIAVSGNDVYAGGYFTTAGGNQANRIAKWNGASWTALGSGVASNDSCLYCALVQAITIKGSTVYVGGHFDIAGGVGAKNIAQWNGSAWSPVGTSGVNAPYNWSYVYAILPVGNDVYVGGEFASAKSPPPSKVTKKTASGVVASNIAKWNGNTWSSVGGGLDGEVLALAVSGNNIYAGGYFATAGETDASGVVIWDGSHWSTLGSGLGGCYSSDCSGQPSVQALATGASGIYAGGGFSMAGNKPSYNFARWTKSTLTNSVFIPFVRK